MHKNVASKPSLINVYNPKKSTLKGNMEFNFFSNPQVQFGPGKIAQLPTLAKFYGNRLLLITGAASFKKSHLWEPLLTALKNQSVTVHQAIVNEEPSPLIIDAIVDTHRDKKIDVIAAIGGGSAIDAGKAVSAMMTKTESVIEYLEGVGSRSHDGRKIPFIAIPTTSGTGSEATKNAVISQVGPNGFKKSLRHDNFIPDVAIVDPELTLGCPHDITAACGMDALTQLLESLVSTQSSILTDSIALGALKTLGDSLITAASEQPDDIDARTKISYASYISGLTLANAGLGLVHGFASVIGGLFKIPHGVVCGTLLSEVTRQNIELLISLDPNSPALNKYAKAARFLSSSPIPEDAVVNSRLLATILTEWTEQLNMPHLGEYGVTLKDIDRIVSETGQKNNPVQLPNKKMADILEARI